MAKEELIQTKYPPLDELSLVSTQKKLVESICDWTDVGILMDEGGNLIVILLDKEKLVSSMRINLSPQDYCSAIQALLKKEGKLRFGFYQGGKIEPHEILSLDSISQIWQKIKNQTVDITIKDLEPKLEKIEKGIKDTGRGGDFSVETRRRVMQFSHGRCMFEGCGEDLCVDDLSGFKGNYSYLAHNIASSEAGPRGGVVVSAKLSDDPNNVLLLCDKHHRLIDKIAASDFNASILSDMRENFGRAANQLLAGLSYNPIPVYAILWPVNGHVISAPNSTQIARSLSIINSRIVGNIHILSDNNELLRDSNLEDMWKLMPKSIEQVSQALLSQTNHHKHQAALFAFGFMPSLVGLGSQIGNKSNIVPMLRFRDSSSWVWPRDEARKKDEIYNISGIESLSMNESEVCVSISLTGKPSQFERFAKINGLKHIEVISEQGNMGNGAIAHPEEAINFMNDMHQLFHLLRDKYHVAKIHLFTCASNAVCVFLGKAIDNNHPEFLVYDFNHDSLVPRLKITPSSNKIELGNLTSNN